MITFVRLTVVMYDWFMIKFGERGINHFGRIHEPKRTRRKWLHGISHMIGEVITNT